MAMLNAVVLIVDERTGSSREVAASGLTIGRDASCDIVLASTGASRHHATIQWQDGELVLHDESANGTAVNGARVNRTMRLQDEDRIEIGGETLRLEWVRSQALAVASEAEQRSLAQQATVLLRGVDEAARIAPPDSQPAAAPLAMLEVRNGRQTGRTIPVLGPVCSLGRAESSDVRIAEPSVSASHATLLRKGTQWFVVDLGSSNGTFVDGYRVAGEREVPNGCVLGVGDVELIFRTTFRPGRDGGGTRLVVGLAERFAKLW